MKGVRGEVDGVWAWRSVGRVVRVFVCEEMKTE